eukprot:1352965-Amorphochlora_amoeboformis.AAC.2
MGVLCADGGYANTWICLTLGYDEERYNAFRHFANTLVVAFAGSYLEISFFVLRREIHKYA